LVWWWQNERKWHLLTHKSSSSKPTYPPGSLNGWKREETSSLGCAVLEAATTLCAPGLYEISQYDFAASTLNRQYVFPACFLRNELACKRMWCSKLLQHTSTSIGTGDTYPTHNPVCARVQL
jgi:hypothetical protein